MADTRTPAVRAFTASALVTGALLLRGQLRQPTRHVARRLAFADGTTSEVYRETVRRGAPTRDPALLVVQFQLRLVGTRPWAHALFRVESIANTPLFAGFPGFRSKLWLTDLATGVYRGVYEWDGAERAGAYAATLSRLLRLVSRRGSVHYHVQPGLRRDDVVADPSVLGLVAAGPDDGWWQVVPAA